MTGTLLNFLIYSSISVKNTENNYSTMIALSADRTD